MLGDVGNVAVVVEAMAVVVVATVRGVVIRLELAVEGRTEGRLVDRRRIVVAIRVVRAIVVLLVVGPERLPEFMQVMGRNIWKVKHATEELKSNLNLPSLDSIKKDLLDDDDKI